MRLDNINDISLLRELESVGKNARIQMIEADDNVLGSLKWHLKQDGKITMKDERIVNTKLLDTDFVDSSVFIGLQKLMDMKVLNKRLWIVLLQHFI